MTNTIVAKKDDSSGTLTHVKLDTGVEETKQKAIQNINAGHTYKTKAGANVHVVANKYLRTDNNDTEKDNLENVPNY